MKSMKKKLLLLAQRNSRVVSLRLLRSFCGVFISLLLGFLLSIFYTGSLYTDISRAKQWEYRRQSPRVAPRAELASPRSYHADSVMDRSTADTRSLYGIEAHRTSKVNLSRQSILDFTYWRALVRREGRDLHRNPPYIRIHSDATNVLYGGTLVFNTAPGYLGLWEGQGFRNTEDCAQYINFRELCTFRVLLLKYFCSYVSDHHVQKILLHEDNQAVVVVLNSIMAASRPMMAEIHNLQISLQFLGLKIEAR